MKEWLARNQGMILYSMLAVSILIFVLAPFFKPPSTCVNGECGFELGCVQEVTIEIANENGVQVLQQHCVKEGWVRDTDYVKELKEAGFRVNEVRFD